MNLDQITTKCWILALIIRDDGERLLLGDGWFDFKDSLQHFQPNSIANDIVELQGTDGQLLAGQVRRSASQSFDGYIGDALTSKTEIENRRRQFLQFFRTRRHYKVIYIFPDGTAIQRRMGYLTDAPSVPEMWQKFPEYHVALNFEDVNYYEYAENAQGDEIYAHDSLVKLISVQSGGLIWDGIGAVSHGYTWLDPQTVTGDYITVTDGATGSPLTLSQLTGNATQQTYSGKNLFSGDFAQFDNTGGTGSTYSYFKLPTNDVYTLTLIAKNNVSTYGNISIGFNTNGGDVSNGYKWVYQSQYTSATKGQVISATNIRSSNENYGFVFMYPKTSEGLQWLTNNFDIQLELGSATTYEPYVGGIPAPNSQFPMPISTVIGENTLTVTGKNLCSSTWESGAYDANGAKTNDGSSMRTANFVTVAPSTTYKVSRNGEGLAMNVFQYQSDGTLITRATIGATSSFTTDAQTSKITMFRGASGGSEGIQLELGSTATDYEPYHGQEYSIYLGSIELCKIGTYQDKIYFDADTSKWMLHKEVGKVDLGTLTWINEEDATQSGQFRANVNSIASGEPLLFGAIMCSNLIWQEGNVAYNALQNGYIALTNSQSTLLLRARDASFTGLTDGAFKSLVNGWECYYALATPTTTEITDETLLSQLNFIASLYGGVNNISIVGTGAQGTITIDYYADVDTTGAGYEWEAGEGGGPTIVQVIGVDNAQPIWTVTGPATNPTLTNITTVQTITWNGTVPNGQKLIVDMANQTATLAGANVYEFITGSWITLRPGANKLTYSAQGADQASQIQWNGVVG